MQELFNKLINLAKARPIAFGAFALALFTFSMSRDLGLWAHLDRATMSPGRFERTAMEQLKENNESIHKVMLQYKEHEPELFRSIMEKGASAYGDGKRMDHIANIIRAQIANYTASKLPKLSNQGLLQATELMAKQLEQLGTEGLDDICMKMMRQEQLGAIQWSDEIADLEYQLARVLVTDSGGSSDVAEPQKVQEAVDSAVTELMERHGQEKVTTVFGSISEPGAVPEGACTVFADYFRLLRTAAEPGAGPILRAIFSAKS